jgi:hypothetical protein
MPKEPKKKKKETKSWFDVLGTGLLGNAQKELKGRKDKIDKKLKDAGA